ncbi:LysE family translocator [Melghirimyces algeriensis]|uniref:Threonine/homoserine/homoserine lactone efflux protein n=1 Tax=Melghirimyces algeriensis TaxID=910412 RepID=A0A521E159_9BACL|nr:LysE family translocator [Melghirimyces algeriensis]SMO77694.1 Threonine/homoserine/homoserine lactone efflux protein [Melghirimyces algeriensis]
MGTFLSFVLLGLSLSVPIGAITIEMIKRGMKHGFTHSWLVGIGGMSADVVLMFLIYFGVASVLTYPLAKLILWVAGFFVLLYLGYESIKEAFKDVDVAVQSKLDSKTSKAFFSGFLIAISNPQNIIFWIGIYGSVLASTVESVGEGNALLYSSAIFIGIIVWDLFVSISVHYGRKFINQKYMKWVSVSAGFALIGFGAFFGFRAIESVIHML